jgi:hypothetical protein
MPVGFPGWTGGSPSRMGGRQVVSIAVFSFESFGILQMVNEGGNGKWPRIYLFCSTPSAVVGRFPRPYVTVMSLARLFIVVQDSCRVRIWTKR